jgi:hypothetical protein
MKKIDECELNSKLLLEDKLDGDGYMAMEIAPDYAGFGPLISFSILINDKPIALTNNTSYFEISLEQADILISYLKILIKQLK